MLKTLIKYLIVLILLLSAKEGFAQNYCIPETVYKTDSVGNDSSKLAQKFVFKVGNDSLLIFLSDTTSSPMIKFQITKSSCDEIKPGLFNILLDLFREENKISIEAKLNIKSNYLGPYQLELLYPQREARNFYIDQKKEYLRSR